LPLPIPIEAECPPIPPPRPYQGYDATIEAPEGVLVGDRWEIQVRPGVLNAPGGGLCASLRGRTLRGEQASSWAEIAQPDGCVAVPEPGIGLGLAVGCWLIVALALAPPLGRRLRRLAESYPPTENGSSPKR
jgi:hypothetical protein